MSTHTPQGWRELSGDEVKNAVASCGRLIYLKAACIKALTVDRSARYISYFATKVSRNTRLEPGGLDRTSRFRSWPFFYGHPNRHDCLARGINNLAASSRVSRLVAERCCWDWLAKRLNDRANARVFH